MIMGGGGWPESTGWLICFPSFCVLWEWTMMRLHGLLKILALCLLAMATFYIFLFDAERHFLHWSINNRDIRHHPIMPPMAIVPWPEDSCEGENMAYNVTFLGNKNIRPYFIKGKKFDCANLGHLMRFKLTDKFHRLNGPIPPISDARVSNQIAFVFASDFAFYPSLRAMIEGVRRHFREDIPLIVYDLGGLAKHEYSRQELLTICNLQLRPFNFTLLPPELHKLKIFAWKVVILAEMFASAQFPSFLYFDTSIHFAANPNYGPFFRGINDGLLSDIQFPMGTHHGLKFATHPEMFAYIPLDPMLVKNWGSDDDIEMMEANMVIVHRSEFTRQMLKWSLLCALTRDCIEPEGAQLSCQHYDADQLAVDGQCHRQDQSVLNILLHNMEFQQFISVGSKMTPHLRYNHPRNWESRHSLMRGQHAQEDIVAKYGGCQ